MPGPAFPVPQPKPRARSLLSPFLSLPGRARASAPLSLFPFLLRRNGPEIPGELLFSGPARQGSAAALHKGNPYALVP
jgi:hypothetical protein